MHAKLEDQLKQVSADLQAGQESPNITTREFLSWIDAKRRGYYIVAELRRGLEEHRLVTEPDFESAYIDSPITFRLMTKGDDAVPPPQAEVLDDGGKIAARIYADPTYRVSKLPAANQLLVSVRPDDSLETAVTKMLTNDYSQLPVMTSERDVKGIINWAGLGPRLALLKHAGPVRDFMDTHMEVDATASLFDVINVVAQYDYVLVRASDRRISGIVTASDLSLQFRQLTEPFLLLGEIENHVRRVIDSRFSVGELRECCDPDDTVRVIQGVADLTFGEYIRLLQKPERWVKLGIAIDRALVVTQLDKVREIRNDVMHFDPDGIPPEDLEALRDFSQFLQKLQAMGAT